MGYPLSDDLIESLMENLTPMEAEVALAIPTNGIPLAPASVDAIAQNAQLPR